MPTTIERPKPRFVRATSAPTPHPLVKLRRSDAVEHHGDLVIVGWVCGVCGNHLHWSHANVSPCNICGRMTEWVPVYMKAEDADAMTPQAARGRKCFIRDDGGA